jgi:hypothetical protein
MRACMYPGLEFMVQFECSVRACMYPGLEFMVHFQCSVCVHTHTLTRRARADPPGP